MVGKLDYFRDSLPDFRGGFRVPLPQLFIQLLRQGIHEFILLVKR